MRRFLNRTISKLYGALPWLARRWAEKARLVESRDVPWTQLRKPLGSCRVALITTGGLHLRRDPPFDMSDPQGDPTYREIPVTASAADLTITHDYYDHRDADRDFNIVFPLDRFRELVSRGIVGALTPVHFSFMGHIDGPHIRTLQ
ncbi:MAG: hypothetical protein HY652_13060, partial [Acidobacteria bacterium]|nr:hypothetical protein [Acidobacteriota bacterium]